MDRARPRLRRPELLFAQLLGGLILRSSPKKSSPNFGFTEFTEVRMQERAHNAPEWRYMAVCGDGTARPGVEETTRGSFFEALRTENAALRLDRHGTARPQGSDRPGSPRPHPARLRPGADQGRPPHPQHPGEVNRDRACRVAYDPPHRHSSFGRDLDANDTRLGTAEEPIHRSAWKWNSRKFEVASGSPTQRQVLDNRPWCTPSASKRGD